MKRRLPLRRQLLQQQQGGGAPAQAPLPAVPAASPPVTADSAEVIQSQQDLLRQNLKKRGFSSTIFGGDTGGWIGQQTMQGPGSVRNPAGPGPGSTLGK